MALLVAVVLLVTVLFAVYLYFRQRYKYWDDKGVFCEAAVTPFGHVVDTILGRKHIGEDFSEFYSRNKQKRHLGMYMVHRPTWMVNDLELVKTILTKDFVHFSGHGFHFDEELEPLAGHLFNADGLKWKNLRIKLTPTFTSSKMRMMFDVVASCAAEMSAYLDRESTKFIDVKELLAMFGTDVIANCAFGIDCNLFQNKGQQFRYMGKRVFSPSLIENIVNFLDFFVPRTKLLTRLKVWFGKDVETFFYDLVEDTVKYRETNGVVRNDFMHLLIQLKNNYDISDENDSKEKTEVVPDDGTRLTMMQLAAQVFVFFIAGFETSSSAASFALYELALNPDIQENLYEEIERVLEKHDDKITYDSLSEMTYMTKVIEETMRKYPALPLLFRICTKDYVIPDTNIVIEKDTPVMIPVYGIHRDPDIYPNPDKFDPERFSPENKEARHHFAYLPFGEGPRICIGSRFGMMQTKLGLATILSKYKVAVCEKTQIPMKYDKRSFIITSDGGVWLDLKKRIK